MHPTRPPTQTDDAGTVDFIATLDAHVRTAAQMQRMCQQALNYLARLRYAQGTEGCVSLTHTAVRKRRQQCVHIDERDGRLTLADDGAATASTGTPLNATVRAYERLIELGVDWANTYAQLQRQTTHL